MAATQQYSPQQINQAARNAIRAMAVRMTQPVFSQSSLQTQNQVTVKFQNVGLVTGFWVKVVLTVSNGSAVQIDLSDFGPANALSNIQLVDFSNVTRINCPGWLINFVNSAKNRMPFGTSLVRTTGFDSPINYGSLAPGEISAPATIAPSGTGVVTMWYYVPAAYSNDDLRGCLYANVVNATAQLVLSFPGTNGVSVAVANATDSTQSLYVGHIAGSVASVTLSAASITVYQEYYDQLPRDTNGSLLLPLTDLATAYEIKQTALAGLVANQQNPYQYANYRDFISTYVVYVNTAATGARTNGADVTNWQLVAANQTPIWVKEPALAYLQMRNYCSVDFPPGVYYFDHRERPISTTQYGNMQLMLVPSIAGTGAYELVGVEDFALLSTVSTASSLNAT